MELTLNQFKIRLANDQTVINLIKKLGSEDQFVDFIVKKSNEWGYNFSRNEVLMEMNHSTVETQYAISSSQLDSNPKYTEFSGCTDNSNFTAQRPSACMTCK